MYTFVLSCKTNLFRQIVPVMSGVDKMEPPTAEELINLPCSIKEFFTAKEYAEMPPYEKLRLANVRQNYEAFCRFGKYKWDMIT